MRLAPLALSDSSRCRPTIDADLNALPGWRDWASLDDGPAGLVAERILANDVADYIRFRAVCRPWRLCSADPRELSSLETFFHPLQWFMLREEEPPTTAPYRRRFMNVSTGQCVGIDLPKRKGHCVFGPTAEGLLVLVDQHTLVVRLLNPLTHQLTEFPSLAPLLHHKTNKSRKRVKRCFTRDLVDGNLSVTAAGLADEGTVALSFAGNMLAVAKPDDKSWTLVNRGTFFFACSSFGGRFYCISSRSIMVVKTTENKPPQLVVAAKLSSRCSLISSDTMHLLENGGEMMLIHRYFSDIPNSPKRKYSAYRVDLDGGKVIPIHGLNGNAVFIGEFRALSVSPLVFPSITADAIYPGFEFEEKTHARNKMDAYRLTDGSFEPCTSSYDILSGLHVPLPYTIADFMSLHI